MTSEVEGGNLAGKRRRSGEFGIVFALPSVGKCFANSLVGTGCFCLGMDGGDEVLDERPFSIHSNSSATENSQFCGQKRLRDKRPSVRRRSENVREG